MEVELQPATDAMAVVVATPRKKETCKSSMVLDLPRTVTGSPFDDERVPNVQIHFRKRGWAGAAPSVALERHPRGEPVSVKVGSP